MPGWTVPWGPIKDKRAGDGVRTHDNDVGNVVLYQLSYTRFNNIYSAQQCGSWQGPLEKNPGPLLPSNATVG